MTPTHVKSFIISVSPRLNLADTQGPPNPAVTRAAERVTAKNRINLPYCRLLPPRTHCDLVNPKEIWRKRVGVEPTIRPAKGRIASFEGREGHRTLFASARIIEAGGAGFNHDGRRFRLATPPTRKPSGWCKPRSRRGCPDRRFFRPEAVAGQTPCGRRWARGLRRWALRRSKT